MMHSKHMMTLLAAAVLASTSIQSTALAESRDAATIRRGAMLVGIGGCIDCHTPLKMGANGPEKDVARGLSGHPEELRLPAPPKLEGAWNRAGAATLTAFVGPWGTSHASNLTPRS